MIQSIISLHVGLLIHRETATFAISTNDVRLFQVAITLSATLRSHSCGRWWHILKNLLGHNPRRKKAAFLGEGGDREKSEEYDERVCV